MRAVDAYRFSAGQMTARSLVCVCVRGGGKKECASLGTLGFSVEACLTFFNILLSCRWEGVPIHTSWGKILPTLKTFMSQSPLTQWSHL